ncbi:serine/threonine-protein kinase [Peribacillus acanthi]|uniref:serine/threonine-protein kinase n=1 Tax=Peribacillus acanthi TaxID=2171554 RepID=UPI001472855F|nr:serine/threonine-protein kinase [Peribacillus acanthi]
MYIIDNKYILIEELARGNQSIIYDAKHRKTKEFLAIKILQSKLVDTESDFISEVFKRDAAALSRLNHPNIIKYVNSGLDDNKFYIVMENFIGDNLNIFVKQNNLAIEKILIIMEQILNGMVEAHNKNIIHRDIKPSNILVAEDLKTKIIDFGISKILDLHAMNTGYTLKDHMTKEYASPEQMAGAEVDFQSDIFSIGLVFYFLITQECPPLDKNLVSEKIENINIDLEVKKILKKSLALNKNERYKTCYNFLDDLNTFKEKISLLEGELSIYTPKYLIKKLYERGVIINNNESEFLSFVRQSMKDVSIYKSKNTYYLIGEDLKFILRPNNYDGYFEVKEIDTINDYSTNEFERNKGIKINSGLNITLYKPKVSNQKNFEFIIKAIDKKYLEHRKKQDEVENSNKLIDNWENVLDLLNDFNYKRQNIGSYEDIEIDYSKNQMKIKLGLNTDISLIEENDFINLQKSNKDNICVGKFKYIKDDILVTSINPQLDIESISSVGNLSIDLTQALTMNNRLRRAIKSLKNGESANRELFKHLLDPSTLTTNNSINDIEYVNKDIDIENKKAVQRALDTNDIFLIQGPPGTGKSTVITEIINQIFLSNNESKVLVTSPSHVAVDHLLKNIIKTQEDKKIIRIGNSEKIAVESKNLLVNEQLKKWITEVKDLSIENTKNKFLSRPDLTVDESKLLKNFTFKNKEQLIEENTEPRMFKTLEIIRSWHSRLELMDEFDDIFAQEASIVASTCVGIASRHTLRNLVYDWVIIDEAARATAPELILPMLLGHKIILVGDHYQLPPIVNLIQEKELGINVKKLEKSIFEDIFNKSSEESKYTLSSQFRMHPNISSMIQKVFYPTNKIETKIDAESRKHYLDFKDNVIWMDTGNLRNRNEEKFAESYRNIAEAKIIYKELERINSLYRSKDLNKSIGVISGYNAQKQLLTSIISPKDSKWSNIDIHIDNVDAFQGSETDVVFYSLVRSNRENKIGFLSDHRRLNVALSRAKTCLYIVGDSKTVVKSQNSKGEFFKKIINFINQHPETCLFQEVL